MNIGLYNLGTSLHALNRWQTATSQNIAASNVPGYKANKMSFEAIHAGKMGVGHGNQSVSVPNAMPVAQAKVDFSTGQVNQTGVTTHVALLGQGFFKIQGEDGIYYTRDGEFHIDPSNQIVNKAGHPVLGKNGPLRISPQFGDVSISRTGEIRQGINQVGSFEIASIPDTRALFRTQGGFALPGGAVQDAMEKPEMVQGYVEDANTSALKEMIHLIQISRSFEVSSKAIQTLDESMTKTIEAGGAVT
jgi:flagellar basal body rod protein FlgG